MRDFQGDDPTVMHSMGQLAWLYYELRAFKGPTAAGRRPYHYFGGNQLSFRKGKFLAFLAGKKYFKTRRPHKQRPGPQLHDMDTRSIVLCLSKLHRHEHIITVLLNPAHDMHSKHTRGNLDMPKEAHQLCGSKGKSGDA